MTLSVRLFAVALSFLTVAAPPALANEESGPSRGTEEGKTFPILPLAFYLQETSFAFGGMVAAARRSDGEDPGSRPDSLVLYSFYTLKGQFNVTAKPTVYFRGDRDKVRLGISYANWPDVFWGIGREAGRRGQKEDFEKESFALEVAGLTRVWRELRFGGALDLSFSSIRGRDPEGLLAQDVLPGSGGGDLAGAGLVLEWDGRDGEFWPSRGGYYRAEAMRYLGRAWGDFGFTDYGLDLRRFVPLRPEHVLGVQFLGRFASGEPPFHRLPDLGGPMNMRGLFQGRFRDRHALSAQIEYRFPLRGRLRGVAFAGAGQVARDFSELDLRDVLLTGGGGIRFALDPKEKLNLRFDLGVSEFGLAPSILVNEAF
jgi:hypothetical protein